MGRGCLRCPFLTAVSIAQTGAGTSPATCGRRTSRSRQGCVRGRGEGSGGGGIYKLLKQGPLDSCRTWVSRPPGLPQEVATLRSQAAAVLPPASALVFPASPPPAVAPTPAPDSDCPLACVCAWPRTCACALASALPATRARPAPAAAGLGLLLGGSGTLWLSTSATSCLPRSLSTLRGGSVCTWGCPPAGSGGATWCSIAIAGPAGANVGGCGAPPCPGVCVSHLNSATACSPFCGCRTSAGTGIPPRRSALSSSCALPGARTSPALADANSARRCWLMSAGQAAVFCSGATACCFCFCGSGCGRESLPPRLSCIRCIRAASYAATAAASAGDTGRASGAGCA